MRFTTSMPLMCLFVAACTDTVLEPKGDDPFGIAAAGKADGSGMLSAADEARLTAAFDKVLSEGESTITTLEDEIAELEADHARKEQEATALVSRIAAREQELRDRVDDNNFMCIFFPNPSICFIANLIANDSTLSSYKEQLAAARKALAEITRDIAVYGEKRAVLREAIDEVRRGKTRLLATLRDDTTPTVPAELAISPATGRAYWRAGAMAKVEKAVANEIALLVELRNAAVELSQVLSQSITTLRSLEQSVDELVEQSREQFMELFKALVSGDAQAAAERWLEDALARRTRELLDSLDWPLSEFARFVVKSDGSVANADELIDRLIDKLVNDAAPLGVVTFTAATPVSLVDKSIAKSPLDVTEARPLTELEVYIELEHDYVGDLRITLQKGTRMMLLSDQVGGSQQSISRTFPVAGFEGLSSNGRWTLLVEDLSAGDTGRLRKWQLIAR